MDDADLHALFLEADRRFEAEQPAADHHRLAARLRREQHRVDVVEVAVGEDAGELVSRHGNDDRRRSGGDDELVVGLDDAMIGGDGAAVAIDRNDAVALVERDAVLDVPAVAMNDDLLERFFARQDRRKHDAIVIDARLGVEDGHLVGFGRGFEQFFERAAGRHAVADDDEALTRRRPRLGVEGFLLKVAHDEIRCGEPPLKCGARLRGGDGAGGEAAGRQVRRLRRRGPSDRATCGASGR